MTIKLTYQQAVDLKLLYDAVILPEKPSDIAESLVKDIMKKVYNKLREKLEAKIKDGYSLQLTDIEAKAYYLYFQNRWLGDEWLYAAHFITTHLAQLDQHYA